MIVFYVDGLERYNFYSRLFPAILKENKEIGIICSRMSIYLLAKTNKYITKALILNEVKGDLNPELELRLSNTSYVISGKQSIVQASNLYKSMGKALNFFCDSFNVTRIIIWNGSCPIGESLRDFINVDVKKTFMEISNLPNRLFLDHRGVNAQSSLMNDYKFINEVKTNLPDFDDWFQSYESYKKSPPKQVKFVNTFSLLHIIDFISYYFPILLKDNNISVGKYLKRLLPRKKVKSNNTVNLPEEFIFCPLQVTNDSQILVNSEYDNIDLINYTIEKCKKLNCKAVIKIHPAEPDLDFIAQVEKISSNSESLIICQYIDTTELIKKSLSVNTINSTVGLEAMIYGKKVTFLGKSFYNNLNEDGLMNYIFNHLFLLDYFAESKVEPDNEVIKFLCSDIESVKEFKSL